MWLEDGGGQRWMDVKIKIKTTTYQFWALLCRCHSCKARQRNGRKKKRKRKMLPKELEHLFHIKIKGKLKKKIWVGKKD